MRLAHHPKMILKDSSRYKMEKKKTKLQEQELDIFVGFLLSYLVVTT